MKEVLGVSLGDSARDFEATVELLGQQVHLRRVGTDGDLQRYIRLFEENDGKVDALGFGGFDIWVWVAGRRYAFRQAKQILRHVKRTPVLDGSGLKNTLERATILRLQARGIIDFPRVKTLIVCAVDRFGLAEAVAGQGGPVLFGDLMFALGLPIPLRTLGALRLMARVLLPVIVLAPVKWLYPTGAQQREIRPKFAQHYAWADVIAGDGHFVKRHMPPDLSGKTVITNTTTSGDVELFRERGVARLVTTTPVLGGRSPGTNVFEAALVAALGKEPASLTPADYEAALEAVGWEPTVTELQPSTPQGATP